MLALVARRGRDLQRYDNGRRLVVGCIPYKFNGDKVTEDAIDQVLEVLLISSQKGQEFMFPKGGWERDESLEEAASRETMEEAGVQGNVERLLGKWRYESKSKARGLDKVGFMYSLRVTEELLHWPEMGSRVRRWVSVAEAKESCRQQWMREALEELVRTLSKTTGEHGVPPSSLHRRAPMGGVRSDPPCT